MVTDRGPHGGHLFGMVAGFGRTRVVRSRNGVYRQAARTHAGGT